MSDVFPIGSLPPVGEVPKRMLAQVIRSNRLGDPIKAFQIEAMDVPTPGEGEVLIAVMAAGLNFNNVWAARGLPIDVIATRKAQGSPHDFHIGGSDASGIVYAVGPGVQQVKIGDNVVVHHGYWDPKDPHVTAGKDPMLAGSAQIWGYNTNFGSFAQFCIAYEHQILPKARHLTWEEAAAPTLVGTTAYRMLHGWAGHTVEKNDVVLVWGGSGGLGSQGIQIAREAGAIPVAVVSDASKGEYCKSLGAVGYIDRRQFTHWGQPPTGPIAQGRSPERHRRAPLG
ncbi:MAG: alcohol dehydrogenase catalytic domain-containing protein, partial [Beijerinckiaceae bacterium]